MENTNLIHEDFFNKIFLSNFQGYPVRFILNKFTNELKVCGDDVVRIFGHNSINDYLGSDNGLDFINEMKKKYPEQTIFGKENSGAMFEKFNPYNNENRNL